MVDFSEQHLSRAIRRDLKKRLKADGITRDDYDYVTVEVHKIDRDGITEYEPFVCVKNILKRGKLLVKYSVLDIGTKPSLLDIFG